LCCCPYLQIIFYSRSKVNVYKQPITDLTKKSKKGLLSLEKDEMGRYVTIEEGKGDAKKVS
jgi:nicotinamide phosphoribosyltransferase